ncbi:MAG: hypothetical protein OEZ68_06760 [Gammaproteobacteria bacterium]|nr:hypothetical protein [Gammaproteobacteria bacterium]
MNLKHKINNSLIHSLIILLIVLPQVVMARLPVKEVPEPLKPWVPWSLHGKEHRLCPFLYNQSQQTFCAWGGELELNLSNSSSTFTQQWHVVTKTTIPLPGNSDHWPQEVKLNGKPVVVVEKNQQPVLVIPPGDHTVSGRFIWDKLPKSLQIPEETGLVTLNVNSKVVSQVQRDDQGRVWLRAEEVSPETIQDRLELDVSRRITDDIPMVQHIRLELEVSGQQREIRLGPVQSEAFLALSVTSALPARWEPNGYLRLQIRPGTWVVELRARSKTDLLSLVRPKAQAPWPEQEVWVFDARNHIRLVEVQGLQALDPRQTKLPGQWHNLPAYQIGRDDTMQLRVIRRGDSDPVPDKLNLMRTLWLDFNGGAYTVQDRISGTMSQAWRLEGGPDLLLGQVHVNGEAQFITRLPGSKNQGVEVRQGQLDVSADSRSTDGSSVSQVSVVGWNHDFQSVSGVLHYPPGWDVFALWGTDNVPNTWLQRWSLLDLFMVLIISVVSMRLWNKKTGVLVCVVLLLIWHEPGAPQTIWVNLLIVIALLRVVPKNSFAQWLRRYYYLSLLALAIIVLPFMVTEVRTGLYPQLDRHAPVYFEDTVSRVASAPQVFEESPMEQRKLEDQEIDQNTLGGFSKSRPKKMLSGNTSKQSLVSSRMQQVDPNAMVQTGPGLPKWQWNQLDLSWNGPVQKEQQLRIIYLSPGVNKVLGILRAFCILLMALHFAGVRFGNKDQDKSGSKTSKGESKGFYFASVSSVMSATLLIAIVFPAAVFGAEYPDKELLRELQQRLLAPPECQPRCADVSRLRLDIEAQRISGVLQVHAEEDTAIPLPSHNKHWWPQRIVIDGKVQSGSRLLHNHLWLSLPKGNHTVQFSGTLPQRNNVQLHLPLVPRYVQVNAKGWQVDGVHENGRVDSQLQLTRLNRSNASASVAQLEPGALPAFVHVTRTLELGLDWNVVTQVRRASPSGTAAVLEIPLLQGQADITEGVRIKDGKALVSLGGQQHSLEWRSTLALSDRIEMTAPDSSTWTEIWRLNAAPLWHVSHSGLAPIHHKDAQFNRVPLWQPWPGESITISVSRPEGVAGTTVTIESSELNIEPGKRATDVTLNVELRSSQGQQHSFVLPEGAELLAISIDRIQQPIRLKERILTFPVHPGSQNINVQWRMPDSIGTWFKTPQVDLGLGHVNQTLRLSLGYDRWVLLVGGPSLGPAVLIWGVMIVLIIISIGLGKLNWTPLRIHDWILLSIGLSQASEFSVVLVIAWLLGLAYRQRQASIAALSAVRFNLIQIAYAVLTLLALATLVYAIQQGLLGIPNMMVRGNQSSAYQMIWYQDRGMNQMTQSWVISVSIMVYRLLMLAWALWLALSLVKWLKWGWGCFSAQGVWKSRNQEKFKGTNTSSE